VNERAIMGFARDRYDATYPGSQPITESYSLYSWLNGSNGALQWRGTMEVRNVTTRRDHGPFPSARPCRTGNPAPISSWPERRQPPARSYEEADEQGASGAATGMWVMDTDIALTTFTGRRRPQRLRALAADRQPLSGLEVVLLSRGNEPMAKAITAADGRVTFRRRPAQGPRRCPRRRRGMASDAAKQDFSRLESQGAVRLLRPRVTAGTSPARSTPPIHPARPSPPGETCS